MDQCTAIAVCGQVKNTAITVMAILGEIVYDTSDNKFYGRKDGVTPSWVEIATAAGSTIVVHSANIAAPSGGNCTATEKTGDWISGTPSSPDTGRCTITLNNGTFNSAPSCTCSTPDVVSQSVLCAVTASSATSVTIRTVNNDPSLSGPTPYGSDISIICVGQ